MPPVRNSRLSGGEPEGMVDRHGQCVWLDRQVVVRQQQLAVGRQPAQAVLQDRAVAEIGGDRALLQLRKSLVVGFDDDHLGREGALAQNLAERFLRRGPAQHPDLLPGQGFDAGRPAGRITRPAPLTKVEIEKSTLSRRDRGALVSSRDARSQSRP